MSAAPLVSVIVPTYRPGEGLDRVIASLDGQTLPQDRFEVIVVDDGSEDGTFERAGEFAATRPNMRVTAIENSGWASRPRNVGTELATGDYVLFMDHDDELFPDGLRAVVEYAIAHRADMVSPKESRTSNPWWGLRGLRFGNIPNVLPDGDIDLLRPMVPHKLYRRAFLNEHGIRFPEGRRVFWEDNFQNIEVLRRAEVVSVLADTPVYLWYETEVNNSSSYGPLSDEFWDRLDDLTAFIEETLDGPGWAAARKAALLHEHRWRLLHRLTRATTANEDGPALERAYDRATTIQAAHLPPEWDRELGAVDRLRAALVRARRPDLLREVDAGDQAITFELETTAMRWQGTTLRVEVAARLLQNGQPLTFREQDGRLSRIVPAAVAEAVDPAILDVTDEADSLVIEVAVRGRAQPVSWELPADLTVRRERHGDDRVTLVATGTVVLDLGAAQSGRPLADEVWDVIAITRWGGIGRRTTVPGIAPRTLLADGRGVVAYRGRRGALAIDATQTLRSVVADGGLPTSGSIGRRRRPVVVPLPRVVVTGTTALPVQVLATEVEGGLERVLPAVVRGEDGAARFELTVDLPRGVHDLRIRLGEGAPEVALPRRLSVLRDDSMVLHRPASPPPEPPTVAQRAAQRLKRIASSGS